MSFRHLSAVKTLNGKSGLRDRKCRFSVMSASAPAHSVYAAISASASFRPLISYLAPNSKGIKKSSSIGAKILMNLTKLWNSFGVKFALTSSTIVRHIQIECAGKLSTRSFKRDSQLCFLKKPRPNIYSLASSTRRSLKLFLPKRFSNLTQMLYDFFLAHPCKRRRSFGYGFTQLFPQPFCFFDIFAFHNLLPLFTNAYEIENPKYARYSLESMTKSKFFFPDSFSCLPELFYDIFLAHLENGRRIFSNYFSYLIQMFFCFLGLFHFLSPCIKITMKQARCQGVVR